MSIDVEYRKNVLFIRGRGRFDRDKYNKVLMEAVELGVKLIVLNLNEVRVITINEIKFIDRLNTSILKKKILILMVDSNRWNTLFSNIIKIDTEIEAFSLI